jgi:(p)ppGpp synthase/HD superfamily hydrolase
MQEDFPNLKLITRSWLAGAGMFKALHAVNLGLEWHDGFRKDGTTPEFVHQLSQIQHVRSLVSIERDDLEGVICTIALHDLPEDKKYNIDHVHREFGPVIGLAVERMSKKFYGENADQSDERYYYDIGRNLYASLSKGCDRVHNHASMLGVFTSDKMFEYMKESEDLVLPMLKQARKNFPAQEIAYTSLRHRLREQMHLIRSAYQVGFDKAYSYS